MSDCVYADVRKSIVMKNSVFVPCSLLTGREIFLAENFIKMHEVFCTTLASLFRRKSENLFIILKKTSVGSKEEIIKENIIGAVNVESTVYHCIPNVHELSADDLFCFFKIAAKKNIKCISGEKTSTEFLINTLVKYSEAELTNDSKFSLQSVINYKMMKLCEERKSELLKELQAKKLSFRQQKDGNENLSYKSYEARDVNLNGDETVIRCTEDDMERLFSLQKEYIKTEVVLPQRKVTDSEVSVMLRQILKNQLCLAIILDGDIVAKANTNAIGMNCIQIGGVYTHPLYRKNGYAEKLVSVICRRAIRAEKEPVLFVKEKNMPAFNLYRKLGFEECGHYAIAYF